MRLENRFVYVLDLETDNVNVSYCNVLEIGISAVDFRYKMIYPILDILIKPDMIVPDECWIFQNSIPKLSNYNLQQKGVKLQDIKPFLQSFFNQFWITSYNQNFDLKVLENCGFKIPNRYYDPMLVLTPIMKIPHNYYGVKWPSVEESYHYLFGNGIIENHRALLDSLIESQIILEMYKRGYFQTHDR